MIFQLNADPAQIPDPALAEADGLLAVGGDLSPSRLLHAYQNGIFPWYGDDTPILWYAPHERFVLDPKNIRISKSMRQTLRSDRFRWTYNQAFSAVIDCCAKATRKDQDGTWIGTDMRNAYIQLHELGFAHSIEVWNTENELVGGLYGVLIGQVFSGESMFSLVSNSSKYALIQLAKHANLKLIDCQVHSEHLESLGANMISQDSYMQLLDQQEYTKNGLDLLIPGPQNNK
ncbi:leucyl/phenylalanyl-tRNA--protein transferase [Sphingobacterium sp. lm-10]|uniref:leucyl/phenylalanyl-tRNA--protein transferase n=1 Tax=Sphingobacterium sp. lm-10 TaxID=2944904 RepID=UPI00201FDD80|nr:leucyl/phenylalanyl-tRNA--protein transferase [Sphingobacterium sp. lm-10]MCL7988220.1 leucyl/phenylalanyl-tRNA--protein transferase [Sphingobacterium sp. lm-10]